MPMIDVTVAESTFSSENRGVLLEKLVESLLKWENATGNILATANTGAYLHLLPEQFVTGGGVAAKVVRIEVLTPPNALNQEQKSGFTTDATKLVAELSGDAELAKRTWVLIREAVDGGWGIAGHAFTNKEIAALVAKGK